MLPSGVGLGRVDGMTTTEDPTPQATDTITRSEWAKLHRDYRTGDPRQGTAKVLKFVDGVGTCLVPVTVVVDEPQCPSRLYRYGVTVYAEFAPATRFQPADVDIVAEESCRTINEVYALVSEQDDGRRPTSWCVTFPDGSEIEDNIDLLPPEGHWVHDNHETDPSFNLKPGDRILWRHNPLDTGWGTVTAILLETEPDGAKTATVVVEQDWGNGIRVLFPKRAGYNLWSAETIHRNGVTDL